MIHRSDVPAEEFDTGVPGARGKGEGHLDAEPDGRGGMIACVDDWPKLNLYEFARQRRVLGPTMNASDRMRGFRGRLIALSCTFGGSVLLWVAAFRSDRGLAASEWGAPALVGTLAFVWIALVTLRGNNFERLAALYAGVRTFLWLLGVSSALGLVGLSYVLMVISLLTDPWSAAVMQGLALAMALLSLFFSSQARDYTSVLLSVDRRRHPLRGRLVVLTMRGLALLSVAFDVGLAIVRLTPVGTAGVGVVISSATVALAMYLARRDRARDEAAAIVKALDGLLVALLAAQRLRAKVSDLTEARRAFLALERACSSNGSLDLTASRNLYVDNSLAVVLKYIGACALDLDMRNDPRDVRLVQEYTGLSGGRWEVLAAAVPFVGSLRSGMRAQG